MNLRRRLEHLEKAARQISATRFPDTGEHKHRVSRQAFLWFVEDVLKMHGVPREQYPAKLAEAEEIFRQLDQLEASQGAELEP